MRPLLPLLVLAACGSKAAPRASEVGNDREAGTRELQPCPKDDARVADLARAAFAWTGKVEATCVAFFAGESLWVLEGFVELEPDTDDFYGVSEGTAVVTPGGDVRWTGTVEAIPWGSFEAEIRGGFEPVDLDGDGADELLLHGGYSKHGDTETWLIPHAVRDGALIAGQQLMISWDNAAAVEDDSQLEGCDGTIALQPQPDGGKHVEITRTPLGSGACDPAGRRVYAWDGTDLKEMP